MTEKDRERGREEEETREERRGEERRGTERDFWTNKAV